MRLLAAGNMYPPHHFGGYELVRRSAMGFLRVVSARTSCPRERPGGFASRPLRERVARVRFNHSVEGFLAEATGDRPPTRAHAHA